MKKARVRAIARPAESAYDTTELWTMALWLLAAVFLLTTINIY